MLAEAKAITKERKALQEAAAAAEEDDLGDGAAMEVTANQEKKEVPMHLHIFCAMIEALVAAPEAGAYAEQLQKLKEEIEKQTISRASLAIGHCRIHKTFHSHTKRITFCLRDSETTLLVGDALAAVGAQRRQGTGPPGAQERLIARALQTVDDDA